MTTLPERLAALRADIESGKPPYNFTLEINATMHRVTAELIASGQAERARTIGEKAPAFTLNDPNNQLISSVDFLAKSPLVLPVLDQLSASKVAV